MNQATLALTFALTSLTFLPEASAQERAAEPQRPERPVTTLDTSFVKPAKPPKLTERWYGWQTLIADAAAVGLVVAGLERRRPAVFASGITLYGLAAPTIHWLHGQPRQGNISAAIRIGGVVLFTVSAMTGAAKNGTINNPSTYLGLGCIGTAIALDAALFAREKVPAEAPPEEASLAPLQLSLAPTFDVARKAGGLSLSSRF